MYSIIYALRHTHTRTHAQTRIGTKASDFNICVNIVLAYLLGSVCKEEEKKRDKRKKERKKAEEKRRRTTHCLTDVGLNKKAIFEKGRNKKGLCYSLVTLLTQKRSCKKAQKHG